MYCRPTYYFFYLNPYVAFNTIDKWSLHEVLFTHLTKSSVILPNQNLRILQHPAVQHNCTPHPAIKKKIETYFIRQEVNLPTRPGLPVTGSAETLASSLAS